MQRGFVKGMVAGGIIAASVGMMMNSDMMNSKSKKKMMRNGRTFLRRSSNLIGDVADLFR